MTAVKKYWKIRTDEPYLSISLKKLGVPDDKLKKWTSTIIKHAKDLSVRSPKNSRYAFVGLDTTRDDERDLGWAPYTQTAIDWYKEQGYKYYGEIKIEDYEVDAVKYNL